MKKLKFWDFSLIAGFLFIVNFAVAQSKVTEKINESTEVLTEFKNMKDGIPQDLLTTYEGIVVIPKLLNAGVGIGAKRGKGIALVKLPDGNWSNPVFVTLTGGSIGFQVGVQSVDLVLVFKHKGVLTKVKDGEFTLGGDASVTAGPVGRNTSASTDHKLEAEIYSYSRSRGVFAGISINGSVISIDKESNAKFYDKNINSESIFSNGQSANTEVAELKAALASK